MDFSLLPPEINSARMYCGPGSGSLRGAAAAWDEVSAELQSTAETYSSVLSDLTSFEWLGPSSEALSAAVTPYIEWLNITAAQTKQTATQASAAATAFDQALSMTVPPPAITANRAQLAYLIATNFFSQNTPAIAATETAYAQMWAQDATAMFDYATTLTAAKTLTPFTPPQQDTNPAGLAAQTAAVTKAATLAGDRWLGNLFINIGNALVQVGELLMPEAPEVGIILVTLGDILKLLGQLINALPSNVIFKEGFTVMDAVLGFFQLIYATDTVNGMVTGAIGAEKSLGILPNLGPPTGPPQAPLELVAPLNSIAQALNGAHAGLERPVSATLGSADSIGSISVPPNWKATALKGSPLSTLPAHEAAAIGMPGPPGMRSSGTERPRVAPRYGFKLNVMSRPLVAG
ncbi:PPE family protein [Mycobacterium decipiens]|uniref:PPE family protein n=1 Tax=Mycobacterium decipiens TaxID=1430326 RepID=A0A1X2LPS2_9MYCO|nr:PPE family protein [Mycobacterium decipiens]OSC37669.1 hypothetical protein B8W66_21150 [Mycobacterium decipiens]